MSELPPFLIKEVDVVTKECRDARGHYWEIPRNLQLKFKMHILFCRDDFDSKFASLRINKIYVSGKSPWHRNDGREYILPCTGTINLERRACTLEQVNEIVDDITEKFQVVPIDIETDNTLAIRQYITSETIQGKKGKQYDWV